jgi:hypothetical protein
MIVFSQKQIHGLQDTKQDPDSAGSLCFGAVVANPIFSFT